jgi:hypothetical protein
MLLTPCSIECDHALQKFSRCNAIKYDHDNLLKKILRDLHILRYPTISVKLLLINSFHHIMGNLTCFHRIMGKFSRDFYVIYPTIHAAEPKAFPTSSFSSLDCTQRTTDPVSVFFRHSFGTFL